LLVYVELKKILCLKKKHPGVKALFASGYRADIIEKKGILIDSQNFILKPATPRKLLKTVRDILNKEAGRQTNALFPINFIKSLLSSLLQREE
jgi:hypothetical protein